MSIESKRKFILTGGTGFLGSYLFIELCKKGYPVTLLCRSKDGVCAAKRVESIIKWFGFKPEDFPYLKVIEGRIDADGLGLEESYYSELAVKGIEFIHCASDTDFAERNRSVIESVNIGSLKNVLKSAKDSGAVHFHYLSTAYSAGAFEGECPEELSYPDKFTNVYEETKNKAEKIAGAFCKENKIKLTIYRPSIVYGESGTGRSRKFNALYYPVKAVSYIRDIMLKDIIERGGKRAFELGVTLRDNGTLVMPIRLKSITGGKLNLIPVDFFAKAMTAIIEISGNGGIHHIVNGDPGDLGELIIYTSKYFRIEGLRVVNGDSEGAGNKNGLEELFENYIKMYLPYIADKRVFLTDKTSYLLSDKNIVCPKMNYEIFKKCIDYAVISEWGRDQR